MSIVREYMLLVEMEMGQKFHIRWIWEWGWGWGWGWWWILL